MILYHCNDARSFRALWALEELGLDYQLCNLPFPPRVFAKDFLTVNVLGTIPLLINGDDRLTESVAMLHYLGSIAAKNSLVVNPTEPGFADYINFLVHGEATLTFPQTLVLRYSQLEPEDRRQTQVVEDYAKWTIARFKLLDAKLATSDHVAADRFTMADISVGYAIQLAKNIGLSDRLSDIVLSYWNRISSRPAFGRAKDAQGPAVQTVSDL